MPLYQELRSPAGKRTGRTKGGSDPEKLTGRALVDYLIDHPDAQGNFQLYGLNSGQAADLLIKCPQFAGRCDFGQIFISDGERLLIAQPKLASRFSVNQLQRMNWLSILSSRPELYLYSSHRHFTSRDWAKLINHQPLLAEKCPWQTLAFDKQWRENMLLYPDLVLKYREDWRPYHHLGGYDWSEIARILSRFSPPRRRKNLAGKAPERDLESLVNERVQKELGNAEGPAVRTGSKRKWTVFTPRDQMTILMSQPQFVKYCDTRALLPGQWTEILKLQPQLIKYCKTGAIKSNQWVEIIERQPQLINFCTPRSFNPDQWTKLLKLHPQLIRNLLRSRPEFAPDVLSDYSREEWESLLAESPEFLLLRDGSRFSFISNLRIFLLTNLLDFDGTGLDTICNCVYDDLEREIELPTGWFAENDLSPEDFLIKSIMDYSNAKCCFLTQMRNGRWKFFMNMLDNDPDAVHRFLPPEELAFTWCCTAPGYLFLKYLSCCPDAVSAQDSNGNTLLHAALLRNAFCNIRFILEPDHGNPAFPMYSQLIGKGCDPDRKNNCGVSCRDLLAVLQNNVKPILFQYFQAILASLDPPAKLSAFANECILNTKTKG